MTTADASEATSSPVRSTVAGVFQNPADAESALGGLRDAGFTPDQVSVVARDQREVRNVITASGMGAESTSTGTGALLGGITGGVIGWLLGVGALSIPGIGPIVAAGALATTLGGAAMGAIAGGLIGALVGMGVPEEDARAYESSVRSGGILLIVHAIGEAQAREAHAIFARFGGSDVRAYGLAATSAELAAQAETTTGSEAGATISHTVQPARGSASATPEDAVDGSEGSATGSRTSG